MQVKHTMRRSKAYSLSCMFKSAANAVNEPHWPHCASVQGAALYSQAFVDLRTARSVEPWSNIDSAASSLDSASERIVCSALHLGQSI